MAVTRATESPSASHDSAPPCMSNTSMLGSSGPSLVTVDLLANRPDPPNPPDLSDRRGLRLGPTSPTLQPPADDDSLMTLSDDGQGGSMSNNEKDDSDAVVDDKDAPSSRLNKGKAPETAYLISAPKQRPGTGSDEEAEHDDLRAQNPNERAAENKRSGTPVDLINTATNEDDSEISNRATQSESQDSSYPSSLFEEAQDHDAATTASALAGEVMSWKKKEKQKADPEAETGSFSEAPAEEQPFRPLNIGDPGWEKSAGRPPQKLPVRFRDAVGRNFLFPWEKAKMWTGMRRLINSCFLHVDVLGPHVMAGHYDLSVSLPFFMDAANEIMSPGAPLPSVPTSASTSATETLNLFTTIPSSSSAAPGPSSSGSATNSPSSSSSQQQQQPIRSSFVILPELWEDTIEPGMLVVQHMWPFQSPNFAQPPVQPSPPQSHHHLPPVGPAGPAGIHGSGRGRGARGRGRGAGASMFGGRGGGVGGNIFVPPPPPHAGGPRPPIIVVEPPRRGKTRKRQDRA
ncbi:hypothetical protein F5Y12DRAFT_400537 [Xylaria sp. FL1777]|nr:hypothetical protein F5Y12DRAFT_400537 [Xylaria sp. FL1777]